MKKTLTLAAMLVAVSLPALAQPYGPPPGSFWNGAPQAIDQRIGFLAVRLRRLRDSGRVTQGNYYTLNSDLDQVRVQFREMKYRDRGYLSPPDASHLQQRLDAISQKANWDRSLNY